MKNLIIGSLSAIILASLAAPAMSSEEVAAVDLRGSRTTTANELAPMTLVSLAYQGYFREFGIPSHGGLKSAIIANRVDAEILIRSAITKGRLSESILNDQAYLDIVALELYGLSSR